MKHNKKNDKKMTKNVKQLTEFNEPQGNLNLLKTSSFCHFLKSFFCHFLIIFLLFSAIC